MRNREDVAALRSWIASWEDPARQADSRRTPDCAPRYLEQLANLYFDLGIACYEAEEPRPAVLQALRLAGEYTVLEREARREPISVTSRNFYELIQRTLGLVTCWCSKEWRHRLLRLPRWAYDWPFDPEHVFDRASRPEPRKKELRYFRGYLRQALHFLEEGALIPADLEALLPALEGGKGPKKEQEGEETLSSLRALLALARKDGEALDEALDSLLELHGRRARRGPYRAMPEGRICMNGMFLTQLARESGLSVNVSSPYLPLDLL